MHQKRLWKGALTLLAAGGCALAVASTASADVGTEEWNSIHYSPNSSYDAHFYGVDFLDNNTLLTSGFEASASGGWQGMGIRYDTITGLPLDEPAEWIEESHTTDIRFQSQSIGASGNIYFAGLEYGGNSGTVWKYASDGITAVGWPKHFTNVSWAYDAVEDNAGNVYGVGAYSGSSWDAVDRNWIIYKYQSDGTVVSGFPLNYDHAGLYDTAYRVAVDSEDNLIVAGIITQHPTPAPDHGDWLVRKYNSSGTVILWENIVDLKGLDDFPYHILVDRDDNIIVAGRRNNGTDNSAGIDHDMYIVKYAKVDGSIIWEQSWDSGSSDIADRMVFDSKENFYLAGRTMNADGMWQPLIQYRDGQTGELLKSQILSHVTTQQDNPTTESHGGVYIALNNEQLAFTSYIDDTSAPLTNDRTAYTFMLDILDTYNVTTDISDADCSDGICSLEAALAAAALNNGINVELHLQAGTYTGNFVYSPATVSNGDLTILGGYSADFASRTLDPTNTILDGEGLGSVLQLNPGIATGASAVNGSLMVEGITVINGKAAIGGGVLALTLSPGAIELTHNIFEDNIATGTGGGCALAVWDFTTPNGGDIDFSDNIVRNNRVWESGATDGNGGGCSFIVTGTINISNNLIYSNIVGDEVSYLTPDGGGLDFDLLAGELYLTNNTITQNQVDDAGNVRTGAGISLDTNLNDAWAPVTVELNNSIVYNNAGDDIRNRVISETGGSTEGSTFTISHSNYDINNYSQNPDPGTVTPTLLNNVTNNRPFFSTNTAFLYHLTSGDSPCIDTGNNSVANMPLIDLAGKTRPQDSDGDGTATANMGCYEDVVYKVSPSVSGNGTITPATVQNVEFAATSQFTLDPGADSHFVEVTGSCALGSTTDNGDGTWSHTTGGVTENCTVNAAFAINQYTVTASVGAHGTLDGSTSSPQTVDHGLTAMFTFDPDPGYHISDIAGTCGGTSNATTFTTDAVTSDCTVLASFAINTYTVNSSVSGGNGTISPLGDQTVDYGAQPSFNLSPTVGYHVAGVSGTCVGTLSGATFTADAVASDCTVIASFAINTYTVNSSVSGGSGTISPLGDQIVDYGAQPSFNLSPTVGYHVAGVTGTCGGTLSGTTFTAAAVAADCTVLASFAINTYTVNSSVSGGSGTISPSGDQTVNYGAGPSFSLSPAVGYHVAGVSGTCVGTLSGTTFTADAVASDCTVIASFAINTYTVNSSVSGGNGTISPSGDQTVNHGAKPSFNLSPAAGYHVDGVTGTCAGILLGNTFTSSAITSDCTVIVSFTDQYPLSILFAGNGSGAVTVTDSLGSESYVTDYSGDFLNGEVVILTVTVDKENKFLGWSGDGCAGTGGCEVTMDQAREITAMFKSGFSWNMFLPAILQVGIE